MHELGKMFIKSTLLPRPKSDGNMHSVVAGAAAAAAAAANGAAAPTVAAATASHGHHQQGGSNFPSFFPLKKLHKAGFHKSENTLYPSIPQVSIHFCTT